MSDLVTGDGYTLGNLEDLGDGPGFRKIRPEFGVTEFGINAIVLPPGIETGFHYHDTQQELYFVHSGELEIELGDGVRHSLTAGGIARVDAPVHRQLRNRGSVDAVYVIVGGANGYVGRDGHHPEGEMGARPISD